MKNIKKKGNWKTTFLKLFLLEQIIFWLETSVRNVIIKCRRIKLIKTRCLTIFYKNSKKEKKNV
jgi:hypothetical protein